MLYRPESHETLTDDPWDQERIRAAVRRLVADADVTYRPETLWPAHEADVWQSEPPLTTLYAGAAGMLWALAELRRRGHAETAIDLREAAARVVERMRERPDMSDPPHGRASLWLGAAGILVVAWRLDPADELANELHAHVLGNTDNEVNELMWGAPGTMLAAHAMHEWTGEEQWRDAWRESADELIRRWDPDGLWTQPLYGRTARFLGPAHGFAGNVLALRQGGGLTPELDELARATAARTAVVEGELANWPPLETSGLVGPDGDIRVQWCHGAPGIVVSLADLLDEELAVAGAELVWRAGPLAKGAGLCHGTAGNGYTFLELLRRTGDERWLDRARRFAVHALEQAEAAPGRYTLWTGGIGAALFAADCIDVRHGVPTVDTWD